MFTTVTRGTWQREDSNCRKSSLSQEAACRNSTLKWMRYLFMLDCHLLSSFEYVLNSSQRELAASSFLLVELPDVSTFE